MFQMPWKENKYIMLLEMLTFLVSPAGSCDTTMKEKLLQVP